LKRRSILIELNPAYFHDAVAYAKAAEEKSSAPTLFDVTEWTPASEEEFADEPVET
jgi:hypothetical protein